MSASAADVDAWLRALGLAWVERDEREGVVSWDMLLDGRRRHDIRLTLILDPSLAALLWVHYSPPLNDSFRVSYRRFLHWNDEFPFVKFALSDDERPVLTSEVAIAALDQDALGLAIARLLAICDFLLDESLAWLWPGAKQAPALTRPSRNEALLEHYAARLTELAAPADASAVSTDAEAAPGT